MLHGRSSTGSVTLRSPRLRSGRKVTVSLQLFKGARFLAGLLESADHGVSGLVQAWNEGRFLLRTFGSDFLSGHSLAKNSQF